MSDVVKSVLLRGVRGFVAGAISLMVTIAPGNIATSADLKTWLVALVYACIVGGITGFLLAVDKASRIQ